MTHVVTTSATTTPVAGVQIAREDFNLAKQLAELHLWNMKTTVGVAIRRLAAERGLAPAATPAASLPPPAASAKPKHRPAKSKGPRS